MKYSIVISSKTGNTMALAKEIQKVLNQEVSIFDLQNNAAKEVEAAKEADVIFAGFWTDKGSCVEEMKDFLHSLEQKKVFLFGTAGFGGGDEYFTQILTRVKSNLLDTNQVIGEYMCQGKMPIGVRTRYESMLDKNPADIKIQNMIENFDQALAHPNEDDLGGLRKLLMKMF